MACWSMRLGLFHAHLQVYSVGIQSPCSHVMLTCFATVDQSPGFPDQTNAFCTHPALCTAGSSSEVHVLSCHLQCGIPRATCLLDSTATHLQTAHHGSHLWTGSGLAEPEAIFTLPPAASATSKGETHQLILSFQHCVSASHQMSTDCTS